jgi:alpha-L-fucosidase
MQAPADSASFPVRFLEAGDYRLILDYACAADSAGRDGVIEAAGQRLPFASLHTGEYEKHEPLLFIHHSIGILRIAAPGIVPISVHPEGTGRELFHLRRLVIEPVR